MTSFRTALSFFTRLPVRLPDPMTPYAGAGAWFPAVGLIVGLLAGSVTWLATLFLPALLCGALGCLTWTAVTGGLHLDGVADCGDGMLVEADRERRLAIMKDSRLGTFGALALFFVLLFKFAALACLAATTAPNALSWVRLAGVCAMAAILGRCTPFLAMHLPCARPGGMGCDSMHGLTSKHAFFAALSALAICALNGPTGVVVLLATLTAAALFLAAAKKRLGGVTGDVYGCLIELTECVALAMACL